MLQEPRRALRERQKYALRGVPCKMGITAELAQRGRIDEVYMTLNERGEGFFGVFLHKLPQQWGIIAHRP